METGVEFTQLQFNLVHDSRNHPGHTTSGGLEQVQVGIFSDINAEEYGFRRASLDFWRCFHRFYNRVLVVRFAGSITRPFAKPECSIRV